MADVLTPDEAEDADLMDEEAANDDAPKRRRTLTESEVQARLEQVEGLLAACTRTNTIQRALSAEWGVKPRQVRKYIQRVRDKWAAEAAILVDGEDRAKYRAQIRTGLMDATNLAARDGDVNQWLRGLTLLAQLDGLNQPAKVEVSGKDGGPMASAVHVTLDVATAHELAREPIGRTKDE